MKKTRKNSRIKLDKKRLILFLCITLCLGVFAIISSVLFSIKTEIVSTKAIAQTQPTITQNAPVTQESTVPITVEKPIIKKSKLCLVLDDAGQNLSNVKQWCSLDLPFCMAVLPCLPYTKEACVLIQNANKELLLHQPMQAIDTNITPGEGAIISTMKKDEIVATLKSNLEQVIGAKGFNNHEGSLITADGDFMQIILEFAKEHNIYFLDSRTTALTKTKESNTMNTVIFTRNAPFIDNIISYDEIMQKLNEALNIAKTAGYAIMIAHTDKSIELLLPILKDWSKEVEEEGYSFCVLSNLEDL